jgi:hypothetical protein
MSDNDRQRLNQERFRGALGVTDIRELENLMMNATNLAGTFYPGDRSQNGYALYAMPDEDRLRPLAERVPPTALRHYYGFKDGKYHDDLYLKSGEFWPQMALIWPESGFWNLAALGGG